MELILTIFCLLLGGAYCEGQVAADLAQPTAVVTAVATAVVAALITPEPEPTPESVRSRLIPTRPLTLTVSTGTTTRWR